MTGARHGQSGLAAFPEDGTAPAETMRQLVDAVEEAGRRLLRIWPGNRFRRSPDDLRARPKADGSIVSLADEQSHELLTSVLAELLPDVAVVSEEDETSHAREGEFVCFVDPLDGTRQYLEGSTDFAILVSLYHLGRPVLSVAGFPAEGLIATANGDRASFRPNVPAPPVPAVHAVYCDPPGLRPLLPRSVPFTVDAFESTRVLIDVARGHAAGAVVLMCGHLAWDIAAPIHLIEAAGGKVTDESGRTLVLASSDITAQYLIAARDESMHASLLEAVTGTGTRTGGKDGHKGRSLGCA